MIDSAASAPTQTRRARRLFSKPVLLTVLIVAVACGIVLSALFVFPTQQYFEQRDRIRENERVLEQLQAETDSLSQQVANAQAPISVERRARERLSLVRENDRLFRLNVDPADSVHLPDGWPLPGVRHLLGAD